MKTDFVDLALVGGIEGRTDDQYGWYQTFKQYLENKTVLDVGTGVSKIKERTAEWNTVVTTHEACVQLPADIHGDLGNIKSKSFDTVTCFDVIEHVKDYGRLVFDMARIAKCNLVITTPGVQITKCTNRFHWHEFMPSELCNLIEATGMIFVTAYGAEWVSYPDKPKPVISRIRKELVEDKPLHPIGIAYSH